MTDKRYDGGEVLGIMFMIFQAIMPITSLGPNVKAFTEAKIGGRLAFNVIDHVPDVRYGEGAPIRTPVKGQIEFTNVEFRYPTRPDLQILKSLTCSFEAGKTTAIVGPSGSGKSTII